MSSSDCEQSVVSVDVEEPPSSSSAATLSLPLFSLPIAPPRDPQPAVSRIPRDAQPASTNTVVPRRPKAGSRSRDFRRRFFPQATEADWNDWRWQSRNRIRKLEQLDRML